MPALHRPDAAEPGAAPAARGLPRRHRGARPPLQAAAPDRVRQATAAQQDELLTSSGTPAPTPAKPSTTRCWWRSRWRASWATLVRREQGPGGLGAGRLRGTSEPPAGYDGHQAPARHAARRGTDGPARGGRVHHRQRRGRSADGAELGRAGIQGRRAGEGPPLPARGLRPRRDPQLPPQLLHAAAVGGAAPGARGARARRTSAPTRLDRKLRGRRHRAHERLLLPPQAGRLPAALRRWARWPAPTSPTGPSPTQDLAPFYDQAEGELGVSGDAVPTPSPSPARSPIRCRRWRAPDRQRGRQGVPGAGLSRAPHRARHHQPAYRGRVACSYCALCGSYGCEHGAKSSTHATLIPAAIATGNVEMRAGLAWREHRSGQARPREERRLPRQEGDAQEQPAKVVVVSATAVESARLLLNSQSSRFPNGLANGSGLVGKNLLFSSFGESRAHFRVSKQKKRVALAHGPRALRQPEPAGLLRDAGRPLRLPQGRHAGLHVGAPQPHLRGGADWPAAARAACSARS